MHAKPFEFAIPCSISLTSFAFWLQVEPALRAGSFQPSCLAVAGRRRMERKGKKTMAMASGAPYYPLLDRLDVAERLSNIKILISIQLYASAVDLDVFVKLDGKILIVS